MTPQEEATLLLSKWQRERALKELRLKKIERWRYKRFIDWLGNFEPGPAPYGVRQ